MFNALANAGLPSNVLVEVAAASVAALTASALFAVLVTLRLPRERRASILTTSTYGNTGNFGLAIVTFTFGDDAIPFAAVALVDMTAESCGAAIEDGPHHPCLPTVETLHWIAAPAQDVGQLELRSFSTAVLCRRCVAKL